MRRICEIRWDTGGWSVDGRPCAGVEEAYLRFRDLWDGAAGRVASRRMAGRTRRERMAGGGTDVAGMEGLEERYGDVGRVRCYVLGMIGNSYVRVFRGWDMPPQWREDWRSFLAWMLGSSSRWRECGRRAGVGRTGRNYLRFKRLRKQG